MPSLFPLYFSVCICLCLHLCITIIYLSILLEVSVSVFLSVVFLFTFPLIFYISWTCSLSPGFFSNSLFSFNLEKDWENYLYSVLYLTSSVTTANSQTSCISNSSLVKKDRNPTSTSFPELLWEGYSGMGTAMLVAVIVETSYLSGTLYTSLHLFPVYPIWRVWTVTFHHFTEGETETPHGCTLTQHYRTESLFKPMSLTWNMHKILIIRWLIKMIRKYIVALQWQLYLNTDS